MSAPHVAAVAALVRALRPDLNADEVVALLGFVLVDTSNFRHTGLMLVARTRVARVPRGRRIVATLIALATVIAGVDASPASAVPVSSPAAVNGPVHAADLTKFQAGNIISERRLLQQRHLDRGADPIIPAGEEVPVCQSGYTCLKDWYEHVENHDEADAMCGPLPSGAKRETARR